MRPMKLSAYSDLRRHAPRLALTLLFQTEEQKQVLAFLLLFGLELDRISALASEPMLALIRLKWWEDQLEVKTDEAGPLAGYLHQQLSSGHLKKADVIKLIDLWTMSVQAGQADQSENWAELIDLMADKVSVQSSELARQIGRAVALSRSGQPSGVIPSARDIHEACGQGAEFLICLAYLAAESQKRDLNSSPFLVLGLLKQVLFKPASR